VRSKALDHIAIDRLNGRVVEHLLDCLMVPGPALSKDASRVIGMHFFNPVPQMRLVEIIRAFQTSDKVYDAVTFRIAAVAMLRESLQRQLWLRRQPRPGPHDQRCDQLRGPGVLSPARRHCW